MLARFRSASLCLTLRSSYATTAVRSKSDNAPFDVVIVGGGMVGFGLTALLGRTHPSLCLDVGAWDFIRQRRAQPVKTMKVWENQSDAFLTFERDPLAHIVENSLVVEALKASQADKPNQPTVWYDTEVKKIHVPSPDQSDQLIRLEARNKQTSDTVQLNTCLLIGADGVRSNVREAAGVKTIGWDHGQSAVVASLCMGPLSAKHSCLIWSTTNAEADRLMASSDDSFISDLNSALTRPSEPTPLPATILTEAGRTIAKMVDSVCGFNHQTPPDQMNPPMAPEVCSLQPQSIRSRFPLGFQHSTSYHGPRVALVGDAAHRILPLAGQGVNLGFGDVISLVHRLEEAASIGADLGSSAFLQEYTSDRQRSVVPVAAAMEAINTIYSNDALTAKLCSIPGQPGTARSFSVSYALTSLVTACRAVGCSSIQSSALAKHYLMKAAVTGQLCSPPPDL